MPKSVVSKEDVVRTLKQDLAIEIGFDGTKPDEAAVKGEILVLTDPKSEISRGVEQLAQQIAGSTAPTWFETIRRGPLAGTFEMPRRWNFEPRMTRVRSRARRVRKE